MWHHFLHALVNNLDHLRHWSAFSTNPDNWGPNVPPDLLLGALGITFWPPIRKALTNAAHHDEQAIKDHIAAELHKLHHKEPQP